MVYALDVVQLVDDSLQLALVLYLHHHIDGGVAIGPDASAGVPGLFACGEVLDIDGDCGGYNLQWAWSSGYVAGRSAV